MKHIVFFIQLSLLNKGLKQISHYKHKHQIRIVTLGAEEAFNLILTFEQDQWRCQVASDVKQLYKMYDSGNTYNSPSITSWCYGNKADKGNSLLEINQNLNHEKIMDFNNNNNFTTTKHVLTNTFQKEPRKNINESQFISSKYTKWKQFYHNHIPPTVRSFDRNSRN